MDKKQSPRIKTDYNELLEKLHVAEQQKLIDDVNREGADEFNPKPPPPSPGPA